MLNINEAELKDAIATKAADEILRADDDLSGMIRKEVNLRLDKIFSDRAEAQIQQAIDAAVSNSFEREYTRVTSWGEPEGKPTTIRKELEKTVSSYWSAKLDPRSGKPASSDYNAVTRAEYLMTQVCATDFSESLKQSVTNVTGALKDGMRTELAKIMDGMLSELFKVRSLQDQGKVEKSW